MGFKSSREVPDLGHHGGVGRRLESEAEPRVGVGWHRTATVESP